MFVILTHDVMTKSVGLYLNLDISQETLDLDPIG